VLGASSGSEAMGTAFGLAIAGSTFTRSLIPSALHEPYSWGRPRRSVRVGTTFSAGPGDRMDVSKVPVGALVLIGLGVIFLLHTLDVWISVLTASAAGADCIGGSCCCAGWD